MAEARETKARYFSDDFVEERRKALAVLNMEGSYFREPVSGERFWVTTIPLFNLRAAAN